ncbi:hypothetical protein NTE_03065 [Candidatus Nitrososphaera evergladensis SR1]|uniref:Site-specific recombinase XerD n=2 Tax=Nitrososphaera TaxID=497726 RepID=A0A075N0U8_9ARCH|nr:hypothetical protein NTE_03065 [Candidatus Nitrososphaera evergladensis SR1]
MLQKTDPQVVDLDRDYIQEYLIDLRHRSPQTVDLYRRSLAACGLTTIRRDEIDQTWAKLRALLENRRVGKIFVNKAKTVVKGAIRRKTWKWEPTEDYQRIIELCGIEGEDVEEYSLDDIQTIFGVTFYEPDLFNACVLQSLSGIRAGALKGLGWTAFHKVPDVDGVLLYRVFSKGRHYTAAISERVFNFLKDRNRLNNPYLVWYDSGYKTPFTTLLRTRLYYQIVIKHGLGEVLELDRKSLQHSMRHFVLTEFAASLSENDASILSGHKVSSSTINLYVNKRIQRNGGMPLPDYHRKIAELYKKTPLYNFPIEDVEKWAQKWRR